MTTTMNQHSSSSFSRSHSSPELLTLASTDGRSLNSLSTLQFKAKSRPSLTDKSLPDLPTFDLPSFDSDFHLDTSFGGKADPDTQTSYDAPKVTVSPADNLEKHTSGTHTPPPIARLRAASTLIERPRSWLPSLKSAKQLPTDGQNDRRPATSSADQAFTGEPTEIPTRRPLQRSLTVSDSFAGFAKRSWMSSSRSPSPKSRPESPVENLTTRQPTTEPKENKRGRSPRAMEVATNREDGTHAANPVRTAPKAFTRASNYFSRIKQKQSSPATSQRHYPDSNNSRASSATSLANPTSNSVDTRTSQSTCSEGNATTPTTDESSNEMLPLVRDTLWSSFKTLEMEFKSFCSKNTSQRIVQVQSLLLPFLRSTMNHASNKKLLPEDVDHRATIFNKWWNSILDMLNGQGQQPIPGVDRPILLEAATMLMMRPEWRQVTSYFLPLADRLPTERVRTRSWTNASESTRSSSQSAMLAESTEHNVRNMFVSNLVKQMSFVVAKMSLRHAPLTLVNFAGKTCAYAFFFAPGVADILVRLWDLTPDLIRRAADEYDLPRKNTGESEDIVALFPPKLASFGWTTPRSMWETVKQTPKMSMLVASVNWTASWIPRWKGRDTDLFFIFCKYFYVLSDQFMPPGLPITEKARSPGFVLVQAQLLSIVDNTIHRHHAMGGAYGSPLIDSVHGPDASVLAMPLPPTNLMKGMSENRLIILLKDFLSDATAEFAGARHTFAEAFSVLIKASTRKTSQFDNAACITLCDFLEEVIVAYNEFESMDGKASYMDWNFWIEVCRRILSSLNTMSEVRMLAFIYAIWDAISKDATVKTAVCMDWLLKEETFNALFNNWCPMVRAYYQRLLCWRICRDEGRANEMDSKIFLVAATRLKTAWAHYLYLKQSAAESDRLPPSTAPMSPTVGKKFIIIRQEVTPPQPGLFMGFDSFARASDGDSISAAGFSETTALSKGDSKKRWSLLGKVLSFTSGVAPQISPMDGYAKKGSADEQLQMVRQEVRESRAWSGGPAPPPKLFRHNSPSAMPESDSTCSSPVFEEQQYVFKFFLGWQQPAMPARDRVLARPRLPAPAQARVRVKARSDSPPPPRPGLPMAVRSVSGSPQPGLIHGARNASPLDSPLEERQRRSSSSGSFTDTMRDSSGRPSSDYFSTPVRTPSRPISDEDRTPTEGQEVRMEPMIWPIKPAGLYARTAVYGGRALAEWGIVVNECNAFVDRRRDEGILGLSEVEVPVLSVEGFRKLGG